MACLCNLCMQLRNRFPFTPRDSNCLTVASAYTAPATPKMMGFLSIMAEGSNPSLAMQASGSSSSSSTKQEKVPKEVS